MSIVTFFPLAIALGICVVPVWMLRRSGRGRAQDYLVASEYTRPEVVRNACIAYAMRMAVFVPVFSWGARGELWPIIIGAACFGAGVYLIYTLRRPLLEFVDEALPRGRSITIHEFIARQHGNDPRVRLLAAGLTLCAVLGFLAAEVLGLVAFLKPMVNGNGAIAYVLASGTLLLVVLCVSVSGHSGVMHAGQVQLGMLYAGLFSATVLLLYLHVSARAPMPAHGTLALTVVTLCGAIVLAYRRSKYVDTSPICSDAAGATTGQTSRLGRTLSRYEKILNICLSVLLILLIGLALVELDAAGWHGVVRDSANALRAGTRMPVMGLLALNLLLLLYPLVDVTNWIRLAAMRKQRNADAEPARPEALRGVFGIYASESALLWLFFGGLGTMSALAVAPRGGTGTLEAVLGGLIAADNGVTAVALSLLLVCVFMAALSTMAPLFSASLCTLRYDMLPALWPELERAPTIASAEADARRRTLLAGTALSVAFMAAFCIAEEWLPLHFASGALLAILLGIACAQLSLAPLVLGPLIGRARGGAGIVTPRWALFVLVSGIAGATVPLSLYFATGDELWLWSACPACVGSGMLVFAIGRACHRSSTRRMLVRGVPESQSFEKEP